MHIEVQTQKSFNHSSSPLFHVLASQIHHIIKTMKMNASEVLIVIPYYIYLSCEMIKPSTPLPYDCLYLWHDLHNTDHTNHWWSTDLEGQIPISTAVGEGASDFSFYIETWSYDIPQQIYPILWDIHDTCGFDPESTEMAEYLGYPLLETKTDSESVSRRFAPSQEADQSGYESEVGVNPNSWVTDTPGLTPFDEVLFIEIPDQTNLLPPDPVHPLASSKSSHPRFALDPTPSHLPAIPPRHFLVAASSRQRHQVNGSERVGDACAAPPIPGQRPLVGNFLIIRRLLWVSELRNIGGCNRYEESLNDNLRLLGLKDLKEHRTKMSPRIRVHFHAEQGRLATAEDVQDSGARRTAKKKRRVQGWEFNVRVDGDEAKDVKDDPEYSFPPAPAIVSLPSFVSQSLTPSRWERTALGRGDGRTAAYRQIWDARLLQMAGHRQRATESRGARICLGSMPIYSVYLATASNGVSCITIFEDQVEPVKRFKMCTQMTDKTYGSS
ncbi:hypothetical protein C8J56DRAFT_900963 [Mycena floridula]|nr:hypothetical protein C8J56DRAFT_900963 [Mycena floridula]